MMDNTKGMKKNMEGMLGLMDSCKIKMDPVIENKFMDGDDLNKID